jgi:FeS assembly SUF system regulator
MRTEAVLDLRDRFGPIWSAVLARLPVLRISKLTDYGIVLLTRFAAAEPGTSLNAREMAESTALPFPVVSKMLKSLAAAEFLHSQRGAKGGYTLAKNPARVTVAEIVAALEGPIALMDCSAGPGHCDQETRCGVREPWQRINHAIQTALGEVTLADLAQASAPALLRIEAREGDRSGGSV